MIDFLFSFKALQTFSAVAGIEISVPIASITAFITAGGEAIPGKYISSAKGKLTDVHGHVIKKLIA